MSANEEKITATYSPLRFEVQVNRWLPHHFKVQVYDQKTSKLLYSFAPYKINNPHYHKLIENVHRGGLEGLYQNLESFTDTFKNIFLSSRDWVCLAMLDQAERDRINNLSPAEQNNVLNAMLKKENVDEPVQNQVSYLRHEEVKEKDGQGMLYTTEPFSSWEETIHNHPRTTFVPKSIEGLQNLVKWAKEKNLRVRASGYRHSSSELYSDENQVLVSMVDVNTATQNPGPHPDMEKDNELQGIELVGDVFEEDGKKKIKCKVGAATCNYHLQDWIHDPKGGNKQWALIINAILTEISFGGNVLAMCHAAGIESKTISDLVSEIEFVNVKGELQKVTDPQKIKAAAGCFGLLGLVTSVTFNLDEMKYVNLKTQEKKPLPFTVPPEANYIPSPEVLKNLSKENIAAIKNKEELKKEFTDFKNRCKDDFYAQWFWFPLHDQGWVNTWKTDGDPNKAERYPGPLKTEIQRIQTYIADIMNNMMGDWLPSLAKIQTKISSLLAMSTFPDKLDVNCTLEDALHFHQGIQNLKERMIEMDLPIPDASDGEDKIDWSVCQKLWWAAIESFYSEKNMKYLPMRMALEMRITGGSDMIMSPQHHNKRTVSIEVLTPLVVDPKKWKDFLQEVLDKWSQIKDDKGNYLPIRPHWAKRFDNLHINRNKDWLEQLEEEQRESIKEYIKQDPDVVSIPIKEYLKKIAYKDQITEFKKVLSEICKDGGYELKDLQERFSNTFLDDLFSLKLKPTLVDEKKDKTVFQNSSFFKPKVMNAERKESEPQVRLGKH